MTCKLSPPSEKYEENRIVRLTMFHSMSKIKSDIEKTMNGA